MGTDVYYYDPLVWEGIHDADVVQRQIEADEIALKKHYNTDVHILPLEGTDKFVDDWNNMGSNGNPIDAVVVFTHANEGLWVSDSTINDSGKQAETEYFRISDISKLDPEIQIPLVISLGCNTGKSASDNGGK